MKKMTINALILLQFAAMLSMCMQKSAPSSLSIEGNWYALSSDSSYQEAFFRNGIMWGYSEGSGAVSRNYSFVGDSIKFYSAENVLLTSYRVNQFGKDQLDLTNGFLTVKYNKLYIDIDVDHIFNSDEEALQEFVMKFRHRQSKMFE